MHNFIMDRLKRIQRVRRAAFCSRDFFLLLDNVPAHKAVFGNFSQKNYLLSPTCTLQIYLRQTIFCSPS